MLKINKAKAQLILDQPFFASMLYSMPFTEDNSQPTMATDGFSIRYNSDFVESLSVSEIVFVLAHEIMHCVMQHMGRRKSYDPMKWNVAADYVVNDILKADRIGVMPKGALHDSALVAKGQGTTEGVYALLPQNPPKPDFGGDLQGDGKPDQGKDAAQQSEREAKQKIDIINAQRAAMACGKLSSGMQRLISEAVRSKVDWKEVLRRFMSERTKTDWSYAKPKRRWLGEDLILPSLSGERMGTVVLAIDCSGSIDDAMLSYFGAEVRSILAASNPAKIEVIYFDSRICGEATFENAEELRLEAHGGGGTAFSPIFEHIAAKDMQPAACIVLTDLCCSDFGSDPGYPVLWASTMRGQAPFGEIVSIEQ